MTSPGFLRERIPAAGNFGRQRMLSAIGLTAANAHRAIFSQFLRGGGSAAAGPSGTGEPGGGGLLGREVEPGGASMQVPKGATADG